MTQLPDRPNLPAKRPTQPEKTDQRQQITNQKKLDDQTTGRREDIVSKMVNTINECKDGLHQYGTRSLVEDAEKLGGVLVKKGLKTNQIRKFLDAVNQLKVKLRSSTTLTEDVKSELDLLRPKLAYAAARQRKKDDPGPVEPLRAVLEAAIKQVYEKPDFERLAQLIESVVAYHKAAGGTDQ